jgi:hypothetical protein
LEKARNTNCASNYESKKIIQKEKYLLPVVVPNRTYAKYSGGFRSIPGILDNGCTQSLVHAVKIKVYIGILPEGV